MQILSMDIGGGTKNILLYDSRRSLENSVKLVLPTPSLIHADRVRSTTRIGKDIFIRGDTIGGGGFTEALREHIASGQRVLMTSQAAYSIRNDLDEVRRMGIEIATEAPKRFRGEVVQIEEIGLSALRSFLSGLGVNLGDMDAIAVAVQDHGVAPKGMSNRRFRLREMEKTLKKNPKLENLAFRWENLPKGFIRMCSAAQVVKRDLPNAMALVMDTAPAAVLGCLTDPLVREQDPAMVVNVGNCHTLAAVIRQGKVVGFAEHHTHSLTPQKIARFLQRLAEGHLTDEEVFQDRGHGSFMLSEPVGFRNLRMIAATGPNRSMLASTRLKTYFAAPAGDMMMTGAVGLLEAAKKKLGL